MTFLRGLRPAAARAAAVVTLLGAGAAARPPDYPPRAPRAVVTDTEAFVLGEPRLLASPVIVDVAPSPDGAFALVLRFAPRDPVSALTQTPAGLLREGTAELLLWNRRSGRVTTLWQEQADGRMGVAFGTPTWFRGAGAAVVPVYRTDIQRRGEPGAETGKLLYASVRAPRARMVTTLDGELPLNNGVSAPVVVLVRVVPREAREAGDRPTLRVVRADGSVGAPVRVEQDCHLYSGVIAGETAVFGTKSLGRDPKTGEYRFQSYRISLTDGSATPLPGEPPAPPKEATLAGRIAALPVRLSGGSANLSHHGATERLRTVFLERSDLPEPPEPWEPRRTEPAKATAAPSPDARALIALDAEPVTLLSDGSAALYRTGSGALWVVPVERQDRAAFLTARHELHKATAIRNAKQIALGMLAYIQDYDEVLPRREGDLTEDLAPYLRDPDVFLNPATGEKGFTYVHPGVATHGEVKNVRKAMLGRLAGPGGQAIIYADGRVEWEDGPL